MATIESINREYVEFVKEMDKLRLLNDHIYAARKDIDSPVERIRKSIRFLKELSGLVMGSELELVTDLISIGEQFLECVDTIGEYRLLLTGFDGNNRSNIVSSTSKVLDAQEGYEDIKRIKQK